MHLAGEPNPQNFRMTRVAKGLVDGIYSSTPPLVWILLSTPHARGENWILRKSDTLDASLHREYDHLHARGAKIYSKQATHESLVQTVSIMVYRIRRVAFCSARPRTRNNDNHAFHDTVITPLSLSRSPTQLQRLDQVSAVSRADQGLAFRGKR